MSARAYLLLIAELVLTGGSGCTTLPALPSGQSGEPAAVSTRTEASGSKRQPRPSTLIAYGDLQEKAATDPGCSPAQQEELRNKARLAYEQALRIHPNDQAALMALARLYSTEGDYERAVSTYNQAIQAYPKDAALRYELGMYHARRRNWDLALQSLRQAAQADPHSRRYEYAYGLCLARARRPNEGFAVLAKLEGTASAHYDIARMLHHLEQDEACKEHLRLALSQNPELEAARQLLAALETPTRYPAHPILSAAANAEGSAVQAAFENPNQNTQASASENSNGAAPQACTDPAQGMAPSPQAPNR
jgi:tetratricopeptide (TPR) repeat protein